MIDYELFLKHQQTVRRCSPQTIRAYRNDLKSFDVFAAQQSVTEVSQINQGTIRGYVEWLGQRTTRRTGELGITDASIARRLAALSTFLEYTRATHRSQQRATAPGATTMSIQACPRQSATKAGLRTLSTTQLRRLLDFTAKDESMRDLRDVATIISYTGLRVRELVQLRWRDVDFDRGKIVITPLKSRERYVPFATKTTEVLIARRERYPESEFVLGAAPEKMVNRVNRQLRAVCDKIGLCGVTLHTLRRTFAVHWANSGGGLLDLMKIMGWTSYSFVQAHGWFKIATRDQARMEELE